MKGTLGGGVSPPCGTVQCSSKCHGDTPSHLGVAGASFTTSHVIHFAHRLGREVVLCARECCGLPGGPSVNTLSWERDHGPLLVVAAVCQARGPRKTHSSSGFAFHTFTRP